MEFLIPVAAAAIGVIGVITNTKSIKENLLVCGAVVLLWIGITGMTIYQVSEKNKRTKIHEDAITTLKKEHKDAITTDEKAHAEQKERTDDLTDLVGRLGDTLNDLAGRLEDTLTESDASGIASIKDNATTVLQRVNTPKALSVAKKFEASRVIKVRDHRGVR